jgi:Tol biopolymer transport system component
LYPVDSNAGQIGERLAAGAMEGSAISPDRRTIIYTVPDSATKGSIRVIAADGTGDRELFGTPIAGCARYLLPAWNPVRPDELALACLAEPAVFSMRIVRLDGTVVRVLDTRGGWITDPSFSPDGRTIVFNFASDPAQQGGSVVTIPADGSAGPVALSGPDADSQPMWSPDGTKIVFRRQAAAGDHDIFVMAADGSDQHALVAESGLDQSPTWSPDGRTIAFESNRDQIDPEDFRILLMDASGGNVRPLSPRDDAPAAPSFLAWARR